MAINTKAAEGGGKEERKSAAERSVSREALGCRQGIKYQVEEGLGYDRGKSR